MRTNPGVVEKVSNYLLLALIFLEISLVIIYLAGVVLLGRAFTPFDMDGKMTIPSILQAVQLFLIGWISLYFFLVGSRPSQPPSPIFSLTVALMFFYAATDELFKIHLQLRELLPIMSNHDWKPIYLGIGFTTPLVFHRDLIALWRFQSKAIIFITIGLVIFVLGGFGLEIIKDELLRPLLYPLFEQDELIPFLIEKLRVAVEEFSEMLGESLILYGVSLFLVKRLTEDESSRG
ncbi:MAG: hypothetical protein WA919_08700 [Coleofasciculaceae cyanobacterium]